MWCPGRTSKLSVIAVFPDWGYRYKSATAQFPYEAGLVPIPSVCWPLVTSKVTEWSFKFCLPRKIEVGNRPIGAAIQMTIIKILESVRIYVVIESRRATVTGYKHSSDFSARQYNKFIQRNKFKTSK